MLGARYLDNEYTFYLFTSNDSDFKGLVFCGLPCFLAFRNTSWVLNFTVFQQLCPKYRNAEIPVNAWPRRPVRHIEEYRNLPLCRGDVLAKLFSGGSYISSWLMQGITREYRRHFLAIFKSYFESIRCMLFCTCCETVILQFVFFS